MHAPAPARPSRLFIISLLGSLSVISPFAIDMYLPAFPRVAASFHVPIAEVSLTISSYFIGMAFGQIFYGPLLDRFGRKRPLCAGLSLFILASLGCIFAPSLKALIALRSLQAVGGCATGVASLAMVRDFFGAEESAKILSRLFLFIAVSPLLAPSVGGMASLLLGWKAVFGILAVIVSVILTLIYFLLPEGHAPDTGISLKPLPILLEYGAIARHPRFITYALSGAFSFAALFTYVAGSPVVFMDGFHLSPRLYSGVFALLAVGFIGGSQVNVALLRRFSSETLFFRFLMLQVAAGLVLLLGSVAGWYGLVSTLALLFVFLSCAGLTYPNAAALALASFSRNAGSASAMLGFLQLGTGALISTGVGLSHSHSSLPVIAIMATTPVLGLLILLTGRRRAHAAPAGEPAPVMAHGI
jgi:DHA1 family bicyclomycin/chloramphenicol resistance-like MFS transporter